MSSSAGCLGSPRPRHTILPSSRIPTVLSWQKYSMSKWRAGDLLSGREGDRVRIHLTNTLVIYHDPNAGLPSQIFHLPYCGTTIPPPKPRFGLRESINPVSFSRWWGTQPYLWIAASDLLRADFTIHLQLWPYFYLLPPRTAATLPYFRRQLTT